VNFMLASPFSTRSPCTFSSALAELAETVGRILAERLLAGR
jgi:hypothetical protein